MDDQDPELPMDVDDDAEPPPQDVLPSVLYGRVKGVVWVLSIEGRFGGDPMFSCMTAFTVDSSGLLMTCAHGGWVSWSKLKIQARPLQSRDFFRADIVKSQLNSDICILRLRGVVELPQVATFGSGHVSLADPILIVGNPGSCVGTGVLGLAAYPCVAKPKFSFDSTKTCGKYTPKTIQATPNFRIMGHIWHKHSLRNKNEDNSFEEQLLAQMPIIQCAGLVGGIGSSGAPLFNSNGEVVGMLLCGAGGYDIGSHVSVLRKFLKLAKKQPTEQSG